LVELGYTQGMVAVAERWLPMMMKRGRLEADPELATRLTAMILRATPESFERQTCALLSRPDATPGLAAITCPTLLLSGRQDGFSPLAQHAEMQALIPDAILVAIEDAGHMSPVEQPQAVADALRRWLAAPP
jgi:pimeloyl-ACP methyl ester carboxylesterase